MERMSYYSTGIILKAISVAAWACGRSFSYHAIAAAANFVVLRATGYELCYLQPCFSVILSRGKGLFCSVLRFLKIFLSREREAQEIVNKFVDIHKKLRGAPMMETPLTHCTYEMRTSSLRSSVLGALRTAS